MERTSRGIVSALPRQRLEGAPAVSWRKRFDAVAAAEPVNRLILSPDFSSVIQHRDHVISGAFGGWQRLLEFLQPFDGRLLRSYVTVIDLAQVICGSACYVRKQLPYLA